MFCMTLFNGIPVKKYVLAAALAAVLASPAQARGGVADQLFQAVASSFGATSPKAAKSAEHGSLEPASLYDDAQKTQSFEACADQFPKGQPLSLATVPSALRPLALCSDNFAVLYSAKSKTPLVVVERLTRAQLTAAKGNPRGDQFYPDPRLSRKDRAELSDYKGSGMDRGHLAPAADMPTAKAMAQSFSLANMVPQAPENNRGIWAKNVEIPTRQYVQRAAGNVFVFTGPLFEKEPGTMGRGQVWIPTHLFKLVYDEKAGRAWAFVVENQNDARMLPPISYSEFVQRTGLNLLPGVRLRG